MNIPASIELKEKLEEIKEESIKLLAELQLLSVETQKALEEEARRMGIISVVQAYNFDTHEFIVKDMPDVSTEAGREELASLLGVDKVVGME